MSSLLRILYFIALKQKYCLTLCQEIVKSIQCTRIKLVVRKQFKRLTNSVFEMSVHNNNLGITRDIRRNETAH